MEVHANIFVSVVAPFRLCLRKLGCQKNNADKYTGNVRFFKLAFYSVAVILLVSVSTLPTYADKQFYKQFFSNLWNPRWHMCTQRKVPSRNLCGTRARMLLFVECWQLYSDFFLFNERCAVSRFINTNKRTSNCLFSPSVSIFVFIQRCYTFPRYIPPGTVIYPLAFCPHGLRISLPQHREAEQEIISREASYPTRIRHFRDAYCKKSDEMVSAFVDSGNNNK